MLVAIFFGALVGFAIGAAWLHLVVLVIVNLALLLVVGLLATLGISFLGDAVSMALAGTCTLQCFYLCGAALRFVLHPAAQDRREPTSAADREPQAHPEAVSISGMFPLAK